MDLDLYAQRVASRKVNDFGSLLSNLPDKERQEKYELLQRLGDIAPTSDGFFTEMGEGFKLGLLQAGRGIGTTVEELGGSSGMADYFNDKLAYNRHLEPASDYSALSLNPGNIGRTIGGAGASTLTIAPAMAAGTALGGPVGGAALGGAVVFAQSYGDNIQEYRDRLAPMGKSEDEIRMLALGRTLVDSGIEVGLGATPVAGKMLSGFVSGIAQKTGGQVTKELARGALDGLAERTVNHLVQKYGHETLIRASKELLEGTGGEMLEEIGNTSNGSLWRAIAGDTQDAPDLHDYAEAAAGGFWGGLPFGGAAALGTVRRLGRARREAQSADVETSARNEWEEAAAAQEARENAAAPGSAALQDVAASREAGAIMPEMAGEPAMDAEEIVAPDMAQEIVSRLKAETEARRDYWDEPGKRGRLAARAEELLETVQRNREAIERKKAAPAAQEVPPPGGKVPLPDTRANALRGRAEGTEAPEIDGLEMADLSDAAERNPIEAAPVSPNGAEAPGNAIKQERQPFTIEAINANLRFRRDRIAAEQLGETLGGARLEVIDPRKSVSADPVERSGMALLQRLGRVFDTRPVLVRGEGATGFDGNYFDGRLFLDLDARPPIEQAAITLNHEITHRLAADNPEAFRNFADSLETLVENPELYRDRLSRYRDAIEQYEARNPNGNYRIDKSPAALREEFVADFLGEEMAKPTFWQKLAERDLTFARKILTLLEEAYRKFTGSFKGENRSEADRIFGGNLERAIDIAREYVAESRNGTAASRDWTGALKHQPESSGKHFAITTPNGEMSVQGAYRVMDLNDLIASDHPGFDQRLQPRNRNTAGSLAQIERMSNSLNPALLLESPTSDSGSPIIDARNQVLSGNGRTLAIRRAAGSGKADSYFETVRKWAQDHGLEVPDGVEQPVLVRQLQPGYDAEAFAEYSNRDNKLQRTAAEQAEADAKTILKHNTLELFVPNDDGDINTAANQRFMQAFARQVNDSSLLNSDGKASPLAEPRIRRAILAAIFEGIPGARDSVTTLIEKSAELGLRRQLDGIMGAGANIIKIARQKPQYDLRPHLVEALSGLIDFRTQLLHKKVNSLEIYLKQDNLFGDARSVEADYLLQLLAGAKSAREVRDYLNRFCTFAEREDVSTADMFGAEPATAKDILKRSTDERDEQTGDLFDASEKRMGETSGGKEKSIDTVDEAADRRRKGRPAEVTGQPADADNIYLRMPLERVRKDAANGVKLAQEALKEREAREIAAPKSDGLEAQSEDRLKSGAEAYSRKAGASPSGPHSKAGAEPDGGVAPGKSAAEKESTPKKRSGVIEDFGEKIEGARKDYAQKLSDASRNDPAAVPLSQAFPEPDYDRLAESGIPAGAVAAIHALRDSIGSKPRNGWRLAQYTKQLQTVREMVRQIVSRELDFKQLDKVLANPLFNRIRESAELYEKLGHSKSLKGYRLSLGNYSVFGGVEYKPPKLIWTVSDSAGGRYRDVAFGDTREEAVENFKKYLDRETGDDRTKIKFGIFQYRPGAGAEKAGKVFIGKKVGSNTIELKRFSTAAEAREYLGSHQQELEELLKLKQYVPATRSDVNRGRIGQDYRGGKDVTPEMFQEKFGFRGVQFGNWVGKTEERQQNLNEAYDALHDLAGLLNVSTQALSLNGELGLAFGARGKGGVDSASAHYEPEQVVINLTRRNGAGSLAHEWFHALDNYFSRKGGVPTGYLSSGKRGDFAGVRPEMVQAFRKVIAELHDKTGIFDRSERLDEVRSKPYWSTDIEVAARAFESYLHDRIEAAGGSSDYLVNLVGESAFTTDMLKAIGGKTDLQDVYPYPTQKESAAVRKIFDEFIGTLREKSENGRAVLFSLPENNAASLHKNLNSYRRYLDRQIRNGFLEVTENGRAKLEEFYLNFPLGETLTNRIGEKIRFIPQKGKNTEEYIHHFAVKRGKRPDGSYWENYSESHQKLFGEIKETIRDFDDRILGGDDTPNGFKPRIFFLRNIGKNHLVVVAIDSDGLLLTWTHMIPGKNYIENLRQKEKKYFERFGVIDNQKRKVDIDLDTYLSQKRSMPLYLATAHGQQDPSHQIANPPTVDQYNPDSEKVKFSPPGKLLLPAATAGVSSRAMEGPARKQWREKGVESPYFKRWFGNSKVQDDSGKPLVVYHGTDRGGFEVFRTARGVFFSDDMQTAQGYADYGKPGERQVYPAYLAIRNPLEVDFKGSDYRGPDGKSTDHYSYRFNVPEQYDGVIIRNVADPSGMQEGEAAPHTVYIAFKPEQIKSATENNGEFNPENPNIKLSVSQTGTKTATGPLKLKEGEALHDQVNPVREKGEIRDRHQQKLETEPYKIRSKAELNRDAAQRIADNGGMKGVIDQILAKDVTFESDVAHRVGTLVLNSKEFKRLDAGSQAAIADAWIKAGMEAARALGARRLAALNLDDIESIQAHVNALVAKIARKKPLGDLKKTIKAKLGIDLFDLPPELAKDPRKLDGFLRELVSENASGWDKMYEFWINSILSGIGTHTANTIGNTANAVYELGMKRFAEASLNLLFRKDDAASFGEFPVVAKAIFNSGALADAITRAKLAWDREILTADGKIEACRAAISGRKGRIIRIPGRALRFADEFSKALIAPAEAAAFAYREAKARKLNEAETRRHIGQALADPGSAARQYGEQRAMELTFQENPGRAVNALIRISEDGGCAGWIVKYALPFKKTPYNILRQGVRKSPLGALNLMYETGKAALGKRKIDNGFIQHAAEQLLAWGAFLSLCGMADDDDETPFLTGSSPDYGSAEQKFKIDKIPPYSIRLGGTYFSYKRIEPLASMLAVMADGVQALREAKKSGDWDRAYDRMLRCVKQVVSEKTFLSSLGELNKLMEEPERNFGRAATNFAASWMPNIVRQTVNSFDDTVRDHKSRSRGMEWWKDQFDITVSSAGIVRAAPKIDYFGREITKEEFLGAAPLDAMFRLVLPVNPVNPDKNMDEAERLIWNYNRKIPDKPYYPDVPAYHFRRNGKTLYFTGEDYQEFARESGQMAHKRILGAIRSGRLRVENPRMQDIVLIRKFYQDCRQLVRDRMYRQKRYSE